MFNKIINNQKAFTLIEMMIVLLVITIILLAALPNVVSHSSSINKKGCKALIQMVQGQVQAYEMEHKKIPTFQELIDEGYLNKGESETNIFCPNGDELEINNGIVSEKKSS